MHTDESKGTMPLGKKIAYGVGDFGANYCWTFTAGFIMLYCTNLLGIDSLVVGTLMMVSKALDGITDLFMGRIIDMTHSKMGKARFWLFVSTFPLVFTLILLFNTPSAFSDNAKYVWVFIMYTLMGAVFYTMSNIAYSTLTALVTKNAKDRVAMGSFRFIFAYAAVILINTYTSKLVEYFGGGQAGWRAVSILYGIICFCALMVPVIFLRELPEEQLNDGKKADSRKKEGFFSGFGILLKNKYFYLILAYYLGLYFAQGIQSGLGVYFMTYNMNNASLLGIISMCTAIPTILMLLVVPMLTGKFGVRNVAMVGGAISVCGAIINLIGGNLGLFPVMMLGTVIVALGHAPATGSLNALAAAADDYSELKFGRRVTGTIYSCSSIGIKVGTGIGTAVVGFLLAAGHFDGKAATQTAQALSTIKAGYLAGPMISTIIATIVFTFMTVEKENKKLREATEKA